MCLSQANANPFTTYNKRQKKWKRQEETTLQVEEEEEQRQIEEEEEEEKNLCRPKLAAASVCMKYPPARGHKRERENFGKNDFFCATSAAFIAEAFGQSLDTRKIKG